MRRSTFAVASFTLVTALALVMTPAASSPAPTATVEPAAVSALTNERRKAIGIQNGPDSIAAVVTMNGSAFTLFSGMTVARERGTFRFAGTPLGQLTPDPAERHNGRLIPRPVLRPGKEQPVPVALGGIEGPAGVYNGFDRDYAGGGTALDLDGEIYYFYHGENNFRFEPSGDRSRESKSNGWGGIGLAIWEPDAQMFRKCGQILGMNAPNGVTSEGNDPANCRQTFALADEANAVYNPSDGFIYLYYSDSAAEQGRSHVTVARVKKKDLVDAVKAGQVPRFLKYYQDGFSEPGMLDHGTGGRSSGVLGRLGYRSAHVTWLPKHKCYLMVVGFAHERICLRTSTNGVDWSQDTALATVREGFSALYPYLYGPKLQAGNESDFWLLFTEISSTRDARTGRNQVSFKEGASLQRRRVRLAW